MDSRELEKAIAAARRTRRTSFRIGLLAGALAVRARAAGLRVQGTRLHLGEIRGRLAALLRTPGPLRAAILSAAALATGILGLVVAYAVVPQEGAAAQDNGLRLVTITGPGGTRTVAVTRTKAGATKLVPVRVFRTVTGPEGVSTVAVTGAALTDTQIVTQVRNSTQTHVLHDTETSVVTVTVTQPVTVVETAVVTQPETVVVTDTVVVTETETVVAPPPAQP
jgi:hypothetical protein